MTPSLRPLTALAAGAILATLSASGAFALVNDGARVEDNTIESGTAVLDVLVAPKTGPTCAEADYSDGPLSAVFDGAIVDITWGSISPTRSVCIKNATSDFVVADVFVGVETVTDLEVGPCAKGEATAGDTSCGDGAPGELSDLVDLRVYANGDGCSGGLENLSWSPGPADAVLVTTLESGYTCELVFDVYTGAVTDDETVRAQTDRVSFDIVVQLREP